MVTIKNKKEIELMREAGRLTADTYEYIGSIIKAGMTSQELNDLAEKFIVSHGGIPAQKGYPSGVRGVPAFPATLCISINDEVIHGIPSKDVVFKDGDAVSVDLVVTKNGYNGDAARTYIIGKGSKEAEELVAATKQAFFEALKFCKPGYRVGDIGYAVESYVKQFGLSVIKEFQGHGIGKEMHEDPGIPNYGKAGKGPRIEPGMTLCIEPMVIQGKEDIWELDDGWTIVTEDGTLAAHYENTILITENEPKILTIR